MKKFSNLIAACIVSVLASLGAVYAVAPIIPTIPFVFTNGTVANATQVNTDFSTIQSNVNAFQANGSWTPTDASGAGLVFTSTSAAYTQIGNMIFAYAAVTYPVTANSANTLIGGLPVNFPAAFYGSQCFVTNTNVGTTFVAYAAPISGTATVLFNSSTNIQITNAAVSGKTIVFECVYPAS